MSMMMELAAWVEVTSAGEPGEKRTHGTFVHYPAAQDTVSDTLFSLSTIAQLICQHECCYHWDVARVSSTVRMGCRSEARNASG
jgi:hypothetical protein